MKRKSGNTSKLDSFLYNIFSTIRAIPSTDTEEKKLMFINFNFCLYYASVVLLDTTKEATLEWTRYPYGPQAQTPGVSSFVSFRSFSLFSLTLCNLFSFHFLFDNDFLIKR